MNPINQSIKTIKNNQGADKVPELRFPEFEGEWKQKRFEEIYSFKTTNSYSRDNLNYENGTVKNIHYGDIHTKFNSLFDITKELVPFINVEIDISRISEDSYLNEGDLVIADASEDYNDIGKTIEIANLNDEQVLAGLHTFLARKESTEMINGFASFLMKTRNVRLSIMKIAQGTKVLGISTKRLAHIPIFIPQPKEQQKIASFLTAIDQRIQLLQKKKAKLEEYKKGIMQQIFSQRIRFTDDDGNDFPDWEEKRLGELTFKVGKKNKDNISYPIYSINNKEGFLPQSDQFDGIDSNERGYDISMYKIVYENTFAYNPARINVGSIGYSYNLNEVIISSLYVCFKTSEELADLYLLIYLETPRFNADVLRYQEGGVRQYLFYDNFSKIKIPLPSNKEQAQISNLFTAFDKMIGQVDGQIDKTISFKKGLLQKMFV